jgi:hypothetical protein
VGQVAEEKEQMMPKSYTNEPLDDEERELMDHSTWDWDSAVVVEGREPDGIPITFYFKEATFNRLMDAAAQVGESPRGYIVKAALDRAEREERARRRRSA